MPKRVEFRAEFFKEDDTYVGICRELNVSSFGETLDEARKALAEAVEAFLEECDRMGTLGEILEEAGFMLSGGVWYLREAVAQEKLVVCG